MQSIACFLSRDPRPVGRSSLVAPLCALAVSAFSRGGEKEGGSECEGGEVGVG